MLQLWSVDYLVSARSLGEAESPEHSVSWLASTWSRSAACALAFKAFDAHSAG